MLLSSHVLYSKVENGKLKTLVKWGNTHGTSKKSYWPASTVKLLPAVALVIKHRRLTKKMRRLIFLSLSFSSNKAYDQTVDLVGINYINRLAKRLGLRHTSLRYPYSRKGTFKAWRRYNKCRTNCTSLHDLQKLLLVAMRYRILRRAMWRCRCRLWSRCFNKTGYVGTRHVLDVGYRQGYVLAVVLPATGRYRVDLRRLRILAQIVLAFAGKPSRHYRRHGSRRTRRRR